ncbi:MAG TPA: hypothetical protein PKK23_17080 [Nitrospirales bacterium]|nr:hypothetical protein [Nitrospirales bacterium]
MGIPSKSSLGKIMDVTGGPSTWCLWLVCALFWTWLWMLVWPRVDSLGLVLGCGVALGFGLGIGLGFL